jgi:hypothetical protein
VRGGRSGRGGQGGRGHGKRGGRTEEPGLAADRVEARGVPVAPAEPLRARAGAARQHAKPQAAVGVPRRRQAGRPVSLLGLRAAAVAAGGARLAVLAAAPGPRLRGMHPRLQQRGNQHRHAEPLPAPPLQLGRHAPASERKAGCRSIPCLATARILSSCKNSQLIARALMGIRWRARAHPRTQRSGSLAWHPHPYVDVLGARHSRHNFERPQVASARDTTVQSGAWSARAQAPGRFYSCRYQNSKLPNNVYYSSTPYTVYVHQSAQPERQRSVRSCHL